MARLMRAAGIAGVSRRRSAPITTRQARDHHPASDLVRRNFMAEQPNALGMADVTFLPTLDGLTCHWDFPPLGFRVRPWSKDGQMKRARFTEEQIIGVLKEHEAGAKTADLARKHGVSEATLYNWKAKYGGLEVSEAKRLKQLEDENAKLKKLLAEQMLDAAALRELLSKKW
jgi:putative transposase